MLLCHSRNKIQNEIQKAFHENCCLENFMKRLCCGKSELFLIETVTKVEAFKLPFHVFVLIKGTFQEISIKHLSFFLVTTIFMFLLKHHYIIKATTFTLSIKSKIRRLLADFFDFHFILFFIKKHFFLNLLKGNFNFVFFYLFTS